MIAICKGVILSNYRKFLFVILVIILVNFSIFLLPNNLIILIIKESGVIENAQFLCYTACAIISWVYAKKKIWNSGLSGGIIFMVFALRELDIQRRYTIMSVTKTKFFISSEVTFTAKLISVAVLISIFIIFFLFVKKNIIKLFNNLRVGEKWAFSTCMGIVLLAVSVALDGAQRYLKGFNIMPSKFELFVIESSEEIVELAIPILFLMALFQWRKVVMNNSSYRNISEYKKGLE
jgi:hypothetical protein